MQLKSDAASLVADHLSGPVAAQPHVQHVEYDPEISRWYVRFTCEGRDASTIYLDVGQRSLRFELYFMPDPPGNHLELYRWLLRRNHHGLYGARFSLGPDGDVYIVGRVLFEHLDEAELDRVIGACYELVETWFQPAIQLGFSR
ncbi:MAG: YbjN domain-containing protein [Acidimicrobiia bacterium]